MLLRMVDLPAMLGPALLAASVHHPKEESRLPAWLMLAACSLSPGLPLLSKDMHNSDAVDQHLVYCALYSLQSMRVDTVQYLLAFCVG